MAEAQGHLRRSQEIYHDVVPVLFVCKGMNLWGASKTLGNVTQNKEGIVHFATWTAYRK